LTETRLEARIYGVPFDPAKDDAKCEVKAVTLHQFEVIRRQDDWKATVIFDI